MRTLGLIRRGSREDAPDLWPRVRARLRDEDEAVRLRFPAFGWREVAVLAAALATIAIVPEPLQFLMVSGVL